MSELILTYFESLIFLTFAIISFFLFYVYKKKKFAKTAWILLFISMAFAGWVLTKITYLIIISLFAYELYNRLEIKLTYKVPTIILSSLLTALYLAWVNYLLWVFVIVWFLSYLAVFIGNRYLKYFNLIYVAVLSIPGVFAILYLDSSNYYLSFLIIVSAIISLLSFKVFQKKHNNNILTDKVYFPSIITLLSTTYPFWIIMWLLLLKY